MIFIYFSQPNLNDLFTVVSEKFFCSKSSLQIKFLKMFRYDITTVNLTNNYYTFSLIILLFYLGKISFYRQRAKTCH